MLLQFVNNEKETFESGSDIIWGTAPTFSWKKTEESHVQPPSRQALNWLWSRTGSEQQRYQRKSTLVMAETARPMARFYFPALWYGILNCECAYADGFTVSLTSPHWRFLLQMAIFLSREQRVLLDVCLGFESRMTQWRRLAVSVFMGRVGEGVILKWRFRSQSSRWIILQSNILEQRFSNFFQVGTTFISQNVLRTTLLLGLSNSLGLP